MNTQQKVSPETEAIVQAIRSKLSENEIQALLKDALSKYQFSHEARVAVKEQALWYGLPLFIVLAIFTFMGWDASTAVKKMEESFAAAQAKNEKIEIDSKELEEKFNTLKGDYSKMKGDYKEMVDDLRARTDEAIKKYSIERSVFEKIMTEQREVVSNSQAESNKLLLNASKLLNDANIYKIQIDKNAEDIRRVSDGVVVISKNFSQLENEIVQRIKVINDAKNKLEESIASTEISRKSLADDINKNRGLSDSLQKLANVHQDLRTKDQILFIRSKQSRTIEVVDPYSPLLEPVYKKITFDVPDINSNKFEVNYFVDSDRKEPLVVRKDQLSGANMIAGIPGVEVSVDLVLSGTFAPDMMVFRIVYRKPAKLPPMESSVIKK